MPARKRKTYPKGRVKNGVPVVISSFVEKNVGKRNCKTANPTQRGENSYESFSRG